MNTEESFRREKLEDRVSKTARGLRERLVMTITELVQIPSENTPPIGDELGCQQYVHERLNALGMKSEMYDIRGVPGLRAHPAFRHRREYANRPNVAAIWQGSGGGQIAAPFRSYRYCAAGLRPLESRSFRRRH